MTYDLPPLTEDDYPTPQERRCTTCGEMSDVGYRCTECGTDLVGSDGDVSSGGMTR